MRTRLEIQRTHDMLVGIILGELPLKLGERKLELLRAQCAALCWVLGDDHPPSALFTAQIKSLDHSCAVMGFSLVGPIDVIE